MSQNLRFEVITKKLKQEVHNVNLVDLARDYKVTIFNPENGKLNKGWIGQTLDRIIGVEQTNKNFPDGDDFELKSVKVVWRGDEWVPRETMAITMFNPKSLLDEEFLTSSVWKKLEKMIVVGSFYKSDSPLEAYVKFIRPINVNDQALISKIQEYWQEIRAITQNGQISSYSSRGTSTGFIQLRTKGSGLSESVCPITGAKFKTRAFYATKPFLKYVWGVMS